MDPDTACTFQVAFSWFSADFPWRSTSNAVGLLLKGGTAAHFVHGRGFGDMDFSFYKCHQAQPHNAAAGEDDVLELLKSAVSSVMSLDKRSILVHNPNTLTVLETTTSNFPAARTSCGLRR